MFFAYSCSVFACVECAGGYVIEEKNIFLKREMDDHKNKFSLRTNSRIIFLFIYKNKSTALNKNYKGTTHKGGRSKKNLSDWERKK